MPDEEPLGVEDEIGATAGDSHDKILERTLGHERGQRAALRDGPGLPRRKRH